MQLSPSLTLAITFIITFAFHFDGKIFLPILCVIRGVLMQLNVFCVNGEIMVVVLKCFWEIF